MTARPLAVSLPPKISGYGLSDLQEKDLLENIDPLNLNKNPSSKSVLMVYANALYSLP